MINLDLKVKIDNSLIYYKTAQTIVLGMKI